MPLRKTLQVQSRPWLQFVAQPRLWQCCVSTVAVALLVDGSQIGFAHIAFFEERWAIWWPMNGIALGTLLLIRRRHWPWVLIAFALGTALSEAHESKRVIAIVAICNTLEVLGPALVLPRFRTMDKWLAQPGLSLRFMLVAVIMAPVASSLLAPFYFSTWSGEPYWSAVLRWAAGDVLGTALFTPLLLAIFSPEMWLLFRPATLAKTVGLLSLMTAASWFVFYQRTLPVPFMVYPIILIVGTELGLSGAAIAVNILAVIATFATLHGMGPFGGLYGEPAGVRVLLLQFFLVLSLSMTLPVSVARVRRLTTERQLRRAWQSMEALATLDGLTGIANRRRFDTILALAWATARREQQQVALLMIDTDHFKAFNDRYGHPAGDACLCAVAGAIDNIPRRPADLVARYGGEEFAVLLPGTDITGACTVAEAVRLAIYNLAVPHFVNEDQRVTVSIGVASMVPYGVIEPVELIAAADSALYRAKHNGRNQVQVSVDAVVGQITSGRHAHALV